MNELLPQRLSGIDRILPEAAAYGSEFAKTYANHAPMVLAAMHFMGGSEPRMRDFFENYRQVKQLLPVVPEVAAIDRAGWESCIGNRLREADLRVFFQSEIDRFGIRPALLAYLPRLAPGVGASALHALMRLAYALLRMDKAEIANALAYWAATYLPLPGHTGAAPITDDPAEVLARVAAIDQLRELPLQELLWHNIRLVAEQPEFLPVVDWLAITPDTPRRLAATSLALFAGTQEFPALHAVTGMHWLRLVIPFCPTPDVLMRHFWQCIAALMGEMGFPELPTDEELDQWRQTPVPDWREIFALACASYDEHDLSLVFSASQEQKVYGDPLYQVVAAQRVGLVPFWGDPVNRLKGRTARATGAA